MGQIVFQATLGGQTALVGQNTASSFSLNLPLANDTLVGKATTDTLTNKTLTSPTITGATLTTSAFNGTIGATTPSTAVVTSLTDSGLTSGRVTYAGTGGLLQDSANMTFNGTTLTLANDASISGLTVGKGGGSVSTNTAVGFTAIGSLSGATTGANNSAFGGYAGAKITSGADNTFIGYASGYQNTSGASNVSVGKDSLQNNTTASSNTAVGYQAGYNNTTGARNAFYGYLAGYANTTATQNSFIGDYAGNSATTGSYNTFIGSGAGVNATTGIRNTFVGVDSGISGGAGGAITTGSRNTIIGGYTGNNGGLDIRTSSNYIVLSDGDGNPRGIFDGSGNFLVGKTAQSDTTVGCQLVQNGIINSTVASSSSAASSYVLYSSTAGAYRFYVDMAGTIHATATTITAISDERLKENVRDLDVGLAEVMSLKPRKFDWKEGKGLDKKDDIGFIAQEFETVFPNSVTLSKAGSDGIEYKSVSQSELIPTLVKAIQELKAEFDAYKATHP